MSTATRKATGEVPPPPECPPPPASQPASIFEYNNEEESYWQSDGYGNQGNYYSKHGKKSYNKYKDSWYYDWSKYGYDSSYGYQYNDGALKNHHRMVPRKVDLRKAFEEKDKSEGITTLMIRNIPNRYTQSELLEEIDEAGFKGRYNLFYMPVDVQNKCNVGYGFINLRTPEDCKKFQAAFKHYRYQKFNSRKIGEVTTAHVQGLRANVMHFRKTRVVAWENWRPLVFREDGVSITIKQAAEEIFAERDAVSSSDGERASSAQNSDPVATEMPVRGFINDQWRSQWMDQYYDGNGEAQYYPVSTEWVPGQPWFPEHYSGPFPHQPGFGQFSVNTEQPSDRQASTNTAETAKESQAHALLTENNTDRSATPDIASNTTSATVDALAHALVTIVASPQFGPQDSPPQVDATSIDVDEFELRNDARGVFLQVPSIMVKKNDVNEDEPARCPMSVPSIRPKAEPGLDLSQTTTGLALGVLSAARKEDPRQRRMSNADEQFRLDFLNIDLAAHETEYASDASAQRPCLDRPKRTAFVVPNTGSDLFVPRQAPRTPPSPVQSLPPAARSPILEPSLATDGHYAEYPTEFSLGRGAAAVTLSGQWNPTHSGVFGPM